MAHDEGFEPTQEQLYKGYNDSVNSDDSYNSDNHRSTPKGLCADYSEAVVQQGGLYSEQEGRSQEAWRHKQVQREIESFRSFGPPSPGWED
jgi:hypothetical protein